MLHFEGNGDKSSEVKQEAVARMQVYTYSEEFLVCYGESIPQD
jgi:hypothetical protein